MKPKILQLIPTFLRNFNIEQRVYSKLDEIDHSNRPAPWHQSTAHSFEMIKEASHKNEDKKQNDMVEKRARSLRIVSNGPAVHAEVADKRPKKENELIHFLENKPEHEFLAYGYHLPNRIKAGHLTLKQFDQLLKEINANNQTNKIQTLCQQNKLKQEDVKILLNFFKPLYKLELK